MDPKQVRNDLRWIIILSRYWFCVPWQGDERFSRLRDKLILRTDKVFVRFIIDHRETQTETHHSLDLLTTNELSQENGRPSKDENRIPYPS